LPVPFRPLYGYHNRHRHIPSSKHSYISKRNSAKTGDFGRGLDNLHSQLLDASGTQQGVVHVISRYTTTAITISERETRLARDIEDYFLSLAPPDARSVKVTACDTNTGVDLDAAASDTSTRRRHYHNDIDHRPKSEEEAQRCRKNGWDIDNAEQLQALRDQEPINAHFQLLSMMLGSSECILVDGSMVIGQWQSILLVDLDVPRDRTVGVQFLGYQ
jgi:thiamine phosphate synthase YjbQ (UPF0047 family)